MNELVFDWGAVGIELDVGLISAVVEFLGINGEDDIGSVDSTRT